jgi:sarcosine oxidase, subunit alpha
VTRTHRGNRMSTVMRRRPGPRPAMRIGRQPGEVIDRSSPFTFRWDGAEYRAYDGDTIVSALAAAGERVFSRSFKYHRPRGILTATFHDPGCMMQVGDEPNVRAAHRKVAPGMAVCTQNAWPSLRFDVGATNQMLGQFIGAGFYYKTFIKPQRLWPAYEKILQRFAAGGRVLAGAEDSAHGAYDKRYAHPDVLVAGGGPAGMAAALGAAEAGAAVMLVEEEHELGGHLRYGGEADLAALGELRGAVLAHPSIEVLVNSAVTGRYDDNWVAVVQRNLPGVFERLIKARARVLVAAPGLIERPYVFEGNDLPGAMLSTAVRRLINLWAVKPGERAVVFTGNDDGLAAASDLERAGVEVARVVDARADGELVRARGSASVESVELGDGSTIECDLLVTAAGWTAPTLLLNSAGDRPVFDERAQRFVPGGGLPPSVIPAGGIAGDGPTEALIAHGQAVGAAAAGRAAGVTGGSEIPPLEPAPHPGLFRARTHGIVDYSEDVSSKDLFGAAAEGYDSAELLKRYTTATMGPLQGKLETINTVAVLAEATGRSIAETGTTVWRPPHVPITLGALAGRILEPVRYSPMQPWHERHGAVPLVAGQWIRPEHYGDPAAEVRNVRSNVGLIDVTPLGKLDLSGPDVPQLLNFLYVNKWSKLDIGSVRYGVMCGEDGVVLDDGVTGHLGPGHYFMSTTSSGAEAVLAWIEHWLQTTFHHWRVHVTSVLSDYASMNVAGPKSRELLGRLAEGVDLSPDAFKYMQVRTGSIAGVNGCHMWRIGFTGELSYEIHVPAAYGLYIWEQLMEEGRDLGVGPCGIEAQRIMRLEKGHLIVGQDTDAVTQAFSAGLGWLVKLDKEDFAGKPELVWQPKREDGMRLVGLQPTDPNLVPAEASQIISAGGQIEGRVTSSRYSPTLERSICLGLVSARLASPGTTVTIHLPDGSQATARVMEHLAHFDPEGTRLRV